MKLFLSNVYENIQGFSYYNEKTILRQCIFADNKWIIISFFLCGMVNRIMEEAKKIIKLMK